MKIVPYLRLMRPANIVTAIADIFAGFAISGLGESVIGGQSLSSLLWLVGATIGLYGGGIVLNDVFDVEIDKVERPERPIPSGQATVTKASLLAVFLYAMAIVFAFQVSLVSGVLAISIAILATLYDKFSKHNSVLGPVNMGSCRAGNLLLGMSAVPGAVSELWFLAIIPFLFIAGITFLSRGEVHGAGKSSLRKAFAIFLLVFASLILMFFIPGYTLLSASPFLLLFLVFIFFPLSKALKTGVPSDIGKAVKAGILSLIILNATIGAGFSGILYGVIILLLLPLSIALAKTFAVT